MEGCIRPLKLGKLCPMLDWEKLKSKGGKLMTFYGKSCTVEINLFSIDYMNFMKKVLFLIKININFFCIKMTKGNNR